uniref:Uncharacterized protein n=1 Tax=Anopheles melas TaxID=34690 RepID=A0A182U9K9_9DIPT
MRTVMMSGRVELHILLPSYLGQQQLQIAHVVLADAQLLQPPVAGQLCARLAQHQEFRFHLKLARNVLLHLLQRVLARVVRAPGPPPAVLLLPPPGTEMDSVPPEALVPATENDSPSSPPILEGGSFKGRRARRLNSAQ